MTRILIVEDEAIVAADLAGKLTALGYEVVGTTGQAWDAIALAHEYRPDLVLMDIQLVGPMDGIAAAETIGAELDLPVVYLTAHSDAATLGRAQLTNPFGYVLKPFEDRDLRTSIEMALYRHKTDRQLRESEQRLRLALDAAEQGSWEIDLASEKVIVSERVAAIFGVNTEHQLTTRAEWRSFVVAEDRPLIQAAIAAALANDSAYRVDFRICRPTDGAIRWVRSEGRLRRHFPDGDARLVGVLRDITERRQVELERELSVEFLRSVNQSTAVASLVQAAASFFHAHTGCEAVGIRIRQGDDYPYFETRGFPEEFVQLESHLCVPDINGTRLREPGGNPVLECMCGNVIRGRFDRSQPFFTSRGSFWTNSTTQLLAASSEADRQARTRNRCNGEGYESVALIAIRVGDECLGLLQLNDRRKGCFTAEAIALWERLADYLAVALARARAEDALHELNVELENRVSEQTAEIRKSFELAKMERQRLYDVLETLPAYVILLASDYHVPFANRFFRERFGSSGGQRCFEYLFGRGLPCEACESLQVFKTGQPHHWFWTGPDGRDYDIHDYPFTDSDGTPMVLEMGIDITEARKAQTELRQLNETLEQRVAERTAELAVSNEDLTRLNHAMIGRELRMIELKQEVNEVCTRAGVPPVYVIRDEPDEQTKG